MEISKNLRKNLIKSGWSGVYIEGSKVLIQKVYFSPKNGLSK